MSTERLTPLACPFCGEPPNVRSQKDPPWWFVECVKQRSEECPACCWAGAPTKPEVIKRWNTRSGASPLSKEETDFLEAAKAWCFEALREGGSYAAPYMRAREAVLAAYGRLVATATKQVTRESSGEASRPPQGPRETPEDRG